MQLFLVRDYIAEARVLLQDVVGPPFRYSDDVLLMALNSAMYEIARIRPDILADIKYQTRLRLGYTLTDNIPPTFTLSSEGKPVPVAPQYKTPVLYYMAGMTQLIDTEDATDARATGFMSMFIAALTKV